MSDKAHLNGAYYGPAIPPSSKPKRSYHRPSRGGGGGFCCLFDCLCGCIFSCIFKILFTILVAVGIAVLVFWLVLRPHAVRFHVDDAKLTVFNLSDAAANRNLNYDLALNISVRNPNRKIGVYYDRIEARAFFDGQRFSSVEIDNFYQGHKNTSFLAAEFKGSQLLFGLDADGQSDFAEQKRSGVFEVDVKLYLRVRFKIGIVKTWRFKPRIKCEIKVPIAADGTTTTTAFQRTQCGIDF